MIPFHLSNKLPHNAAKCQPAGSFPSTNSQPAGSYNPGNSQPASSLISPSTASTPIPASKTQMSHRAGSLLTFNTATPQRLPPSDLGVRVIVARRACMLVAS
jgi:hypothetical protein